jgi:uncharacterized membrane protein
MIEHPRVLILLCALGAGLVAGIFFAFSSFVMRALARITPAQGIVAMQSINVAVINPVFMIAFLGTGAACAALIAVSLWSWRGAASELAIAGGLLYLVGTLGVTMVCNVPRNNALAAVEATSAEAARLWPDYVTGWTAWNHVRTAAALAAAAALTLALRDPVW